ncbi:MAG: glycosyltransferase family 39 protein [bacterium]|nr:glycosyltransferase family 39 protein [bacterium]
MKILTKPSVLRKFISRNWPWLVLLVVIIFTSIIRVRLLDVPLERDEGEYAYTAQLLLDGRAPFDGAYSLKLPGTAIMYAGSFLAFGETVSGIRLGLLLVNVLTILLLFGIGNKLGGRLVALIAGASYAIASLSVSLLGFTANTEHYAVLFFAAGIFVLLQYRERPALHRAAVVGLCFGLAVVMKQPTAFLVLWSCCWMLWYARKQKPLGKAVAHASALGVAFVAPLVTLTWYVWANGQFSTMYFWVWTYARAYSVIMPINRVFLIFFTSGAGIFIALGSIIILATLGIFSIIQTRKLHERLFITTWVIASLAAISVGFYFRDHYFILGLPALCVSAGFGAYAILHLLQQHNSPRTAKRGTAALLVLVLLWIPINEAKYWFCVSTTEYSVHAYPHQNFPVYRTFAATLEQFIRAGDRVAIIGSEPELLFYTGLRSVTGYLYTYPFFELQPYRTRMFIQFIEEIETAKPELLVVVEHNYSLGEKPWHNDNPLWPWLKQYQQSYTLLTAQEFPVDSEVPSGSRVATHEQQKISVYRRSQ